MKHFISTLSVAFLLSAIAPPAAFAGKAAMTSEELTALISDTTVYGTNTKGKKFIQIYGADGTVVSGPESSRSSDGKWKPAESGAWNVKDGKLCNEYTKPKARSGGCDKFFKTDDGKFVYETSSGGTGSFDKIVQGRAE